MSNKNQDCNVSVWKVDVSAGQTLFIPPCFLVSNASTGKECVVGLKKLVLPKGDAHRRRFASLADGMLADNAPALQIVNATIGAMALV